jgi:hypothetical protein
MRGAVHTINETPPCSPTDGHAASFPRSSPSARIAHSSLPSLHSLHRRVVLLVREARGKLAAGGLAAILALAVKRTLLGVVESSLATPNRPFTPRATAVEFHVDPPRIGLVLGHLASPFPPPASATRQGAVCLLRSIAHQLSGRNPFTQSLTGCAAIPTPARATCGRDKRPGRVRLRRWRACSEARRPPMEASGADSHPERSAGPRDGCERAPRGQPRRSLRRSGAQRPSGLLGRAVAS